MSVDRLCLWGDARRRRTGQNSREKNPKTSTERVAEWDADHWLGQTDRHGTFEGARTGARRVGGVEDVGRIKKRKRMKARVGCASAAGYDCVGSCG